MKRTHSVIGRQVFRIDVNTEKTARFVFNEISDLAKNKLNVLLDQFISEIDRPGEVIRIDKILLDLGELDLKNFEKQLIDLIALELKKISKDFKNETIRYHNLKAEEVEIEILKYFLIYGRTPWWSPDYDLKTLETTFHDLISTPTVNTRKMFKEIIDLPGVRQRIRNQFQQINLDDLNQRVSADNEGRIDDEKEEALLKKEISILPELDEEWSVMEKQREQEWKELILFDILNHFYKYQSEPWWEKDANRLDPLIRELIYIKPKWLKEQLSHCWSRPKVAGLLIHKLSDDTLANIQLLCTGRQDSFLVAYINTVEKFLLQNQFKLPEIKRLKWKYTLEELFQHKKYSPEFFLPRMVKILAVETGFPLSRLVPSLIEIARPGATYHEAGYPLLITLLQKETKQVKPKLRPPTIPESKLFKKNIERERPFFSEPNFSDPEESAISKEEMLARRLSILQYFFKYVTLPSGLSKWGKDHLVSWQIQLIKEYPEIMKVFYGRVFSIRPGIPSLSALSSIPSLSALSSIPSLSALSSIPLNENIMRLFPSDIKEIKEWPEQAKKANENADKTASKYKRGKSGLEESIFVHNAGLIILAPFLPRYFQTLGLTTNRSFVSEEAAERSVHLLQYLVSGQTETPEHLLVLNKILSGLPVDHPIPLAINLTNEETETSEFLLKSVLHNWDRMQNSSIENLRGTFIIRNGMLTEKEDKWLLKVDSKSYDVVLEFLPWSISIIKTPWMAKRIEIEWKTKS